ncbi:MAG: prenyltransferase [Methanomicrobiaceae archaeon]|nr:prenyltransferase [Methanomicrobiaceae archaeon]
MAAEFVCRMLRMGRLPFLLGGFLLFCMGALAAVQMGASPDPVAFWTGYTAFGLVHLSVSYSNEYFDRIPDRAGSRTLISGGSGMLVHHPELAPAALKLALVLNALALTLAASLAVAGIVSPLFISMVGLGALLGWWYSAPPLRLVGRGLGEVSTAVTLGALIPATGYLVMAHRFDPALIPFLVPLLCYGMIFILSVELPDMEGDRLGGKRTFVVRYGRKSSGWVIAGCAAAASLFYALFPWERGDFGILAALSLLIMGTAGAGVLLPCESRRCLVCRAAANLAALNAFVLLANLFLLAGIAS